MNENVHFSLKLNEKYQTFEEEKKLISEFIMPDPGV